MPCLEGMHAPGSDRAHLLPAAGITNTVEEVYRFHRVTPFYPPDPCIRPNEADLVCPQNNMGYKNHPNMPAAGANTQPISDRFAFHKAREGSSKRPCPAEGRPLTLEQPCPCSNSIGNPARMQSGYSDTQYQRMPPPNAYHPSAMQSGSDQTLPQWPMSNNRGNMSQGLRPNNPPQGRMPNGQTGYAASGGFYPSAQQQPITPNVSQRYPCASNAAERIPNQYEVLGNFSHGRDYITTSNAPSRQKLHFGEEPDPACPHPYIPAPYTCQPVYNLRYLNDCPEQDGPPADSYTFL